MFTIVDFLDKSFGIAVGDFHQPMIDFRSSGWVECIGVEIERACLVRSLEHVGNIGEENITEQVSELERFGKRLLNVDVLMLTNVRTIPPSEWYPFQP